MTDAIKLTEEMFKSGQPIAQGEARIWMKKYAPKSLLEKIGKMKNLQPMKLENGQLIVAHSESGHHHVLEPVYKDVHLSDAAKILIDSTNELIGEMQLAEQCLLKHNRENATHGGYIFPAGEYIRVIDEESTPEGWKRVID